MLSEFHNDVGQPELAPSDEDLLRAFTADQSEEAFAELTSRHLNWVYSAAVRQAGNHAMAQDATQAVFIILARKAASLKSETILAGWLFRAVRYAVRDALKIEARRQRREHEATLLESADLVNEAAASWDELAPILDEALARLPVRDRNAVLLRFFERKEWREVGLTLGLNEHAARVRVTRALEKLRVFFERRGVTVSAAVLSGFLLSHAVEAAPRVSAQLLAASATAASTAVLALAQAGLKRCFWQKALRVGAVIALLLLAALLWLNTAWEQHQQRTLAEQAARQAAKAQGVRQAVMAIDRTFSAGDQEGLVARIYFRQADDERHRPVLTNFVRSESAFRETIRKKLKVRSRTWDATFRMLFAGQPPLLTNGLTFSQMVTNVGQWSFRLVDQNGVWKWDFFFDQSPQVVHQRMELLHRQSAILDQLRAGVLAGTLTNAAEILTTLKESAPATNPATASSTKENGELPSPPR
jgi:RNA polymerase sigma factor (sigma-70 family)